MDRRQVVAMMHATLCPLCLCGFRCPEMLYLYGRHDDLEMPPRKVEELYGGPCDGQRVEVMGDRVDVPLMSCGDLRPYPSVAVYVRSTIDGKMRHVPAPNYGG